MTSTEQLYQLFRKANGISTDSRNIPEGCLFFALKGENFDGNKFAGEALNKGAAFAVVDNPDYRHRKNTFLVENTLASLQQLARIHRKTLNIPILGITGTNGKTTTKELIAIVLGKKYNTCFTRGNLNNHIGVPLSLLKMNAKTEFGVVEMGANHSGEIAQLCSIADPDFGIVTNIGKAHLEGFGNFEGVKKTKAELYEYINSKNGIIFYNKDNPILSELLSGVKNKISYGRSNADFTGEQVFSPPFVHIKANFPEVVLHLDSCLTGNYNTENVLAAACIGNYFGVAPLDIQQAIKSYMPGNNRSQLIKKGNLQIIMDAYNANPTSMQASIKSFLSGYDSPKYLILGDMLELGEFTETEHAAIVDLIGHSNVSQAFLIGTNFSKIAEKSGFHTFPDVESLCKFLDTCKISEGSLLIKGSRGIKLEQVLDYL